MKKRRTSHRGTVMQILFLLFLGLITSPTTASAGWTITQLTDNDVQDYEPAVSGSNVVWTTRYDGPSASYSWIHSNFGFETTGGYETLPAISGTNVVWCYYDGATRELRSSFGWGPGYFRQTTGIGISGTNVVWNDNDVVEGYVIRSNFGWQSTGGNGAAAGAAISGTNVVWYDVDDDGIYQVFSNFAGQLTDSDDTHNGSPDVSGENVVWHVGVGTGLLNSNFGFVQDWTTGEPAISGTNVAWISRPYNVQTSFGGQVTDNPLDYGMEGVDISGTTVVWSGWDGTDWEIYMATYSTGAIPAPGAVVLASLGAGLVGWLRRRKTV